MTCPRALDLGAFALGTLEPREAAATETHVANCPECATEVSELAAMAGLLAHVSVDDVCGELPVASADLFERVTGAVDADSRHRRITHRLSIAAAVAVLAGGLITGLVVTRGPSAPTYSVTAGATTMSVQLAGRATGTQLQIDVGGLPYDEHCRLIAISRTGQREPAGSWTAAYGGTAHVTSWTSLQSQQISQLVLLGSSGRRLATLRV